MGRFTHEAVAMDPDTGIVYETEDAGNNSGFYRFLPNQPGNLAAGGKLQMLGIDGRPQFNTRTGQTMGVTYPVVWFDIAEPDRAHQPGTTNGQGVYRQGFEQGGASFGRLEGAWWGNGRIYFVSTSGGNGGTRAGLGLRPGGEHADADLRIALRGGAGCAGQHLRDAARRPRAVRRRRRRAVHARPDATAAASSRFAGTT